jgi:hypothetical protein
MTDIVEQADEIERLRAERDRAIKTTSAFALDVAAKDTEIERLRAAHQEIRELGNNKIVSGEGLFMRALLIARRALEPKRLSGCARRCKSCARKTTAPNGSSPMSATRFWMKRAASWGPNERTRTPPLVLGAL